MDQWERLRLRGASLSALKRCMSLTAASDGGLSRLACLRFPPLLLLDVSRRAPPSSVDVQEHKHGLILFCLLLLMHVYVV